VRAAIYLRISQDRTGEELGVERQRKDCLDLVERRGWELHDIYVDNDTSATKARKRPAWEAMMAEVEAGRVKVVVGWTIDRTLRSGRDRLRMLESGKEHGITISLVRGSDMDLSTPSDRTMADILGAIALGEVEMKADRQRAAHAQAARQGRRVGGRRPFGFEQDGTTKRPAEAEAIVQAYSDYLDGVPLSAIARQWNAAGLRYGFERPDGTISDWNHSGVRGVLRNPRYAGFRRHQPKGGPEVLYKAQWPALVSEQTYRAVVAQLDSTASEFKPKGGRRLLTKIARCGVCELTIHVGGNSKGAPPVYRCPTGKHVTRRAEPIEEFISTLMVARLQKEDVQKQLLAAEEDRRDEGLGEKAEQLRQDMDTIALERMQRKITPRQFAIMNAELIAELEDIERRMAANSGRSALRDFIAGGVTRGRWDELGVDKQRVFIAKAMDVRLFSGGKGVRNPPPETIQVRWKTDQSDS
jgi:DNA invertase Pin-like site-specific DNA recombinase